MFVSLQNSYVEVLTPKVLVFGEGDFGKSLHEVMRVWLSWWD